MSKFHGLILNHGIFLIFILGKVALCAILGYEWWKHQISENQHSHRKVTNLLTLANSLQELLNHIYSWLSVLEALSVNDDFRDAIKLNLEHYSLWSTLTCDPPFDLCVKYLLAGFLKIFS